jgi:hypothetical protein
MGQKALKVMYMEFDPLDSFLVDPPKKCPSEGHGRRRSNPYGRKDLE